MTAIGIPGASRGIQKTDPTLAGVLKTRGATPLGSSTTSATAMSSCRPCMDSTNGSATFTTQ